MILPGAESARLIELLPRLARAAGKDELEAALSAVEKHRPAGYRARLAARRKRYLGQQRSIIESALRARFPQTFQRMPVAGLNFLRLVASQDAGVYAEPPERYLLEEEGERAKPESDEAKAFAGLLDVRGRGDVLRIRVRGAKDLQTCYSGAIDAAIVMGWIAQ